MGVAGEEDAASLGVGGDPLEPILQDAPRLHHLPAEPILGQREIDGQERVLQGIGDPLPAPLVSYGLGRVPGEAQVIPSGLDLGVHLFQADLA